MSNAFRHLRSRAVIASGSPNHRARDLIVAEGALQTIEAKIAYGPIDKDLVDEDVRIEHLVGDRWEMLATVRTSDDGPDCDGGRARFVIPGDRAVGVGRHRIRVTVVGDQSQAELALVVVPKKQPIFVSDIDGTITVSEIAEFPAMARGELPDPHPYAAAAFHRLAERGHVPVYLTARPEWLLPRTRAFLELHRFPPGVVVTRRDKSGGFGSSAAAGKLMELERLAEDFTIAWAFGNMPSDAHAYSKIVSDPRRRVLYRYTDELHGARRIESYEEIYGEL